MAALVSWYLVLSMTTAEATVSSNMGPMTQEQCTKLVGKNVFPTSAFPACRQAIGWKNVAAPRPNDPEASVTVPVFNEGPQ